MMIDEAQSVVATALSEPRFQRVVDVIRMRLSGPLEVMVQGGFLRNAVLATHFGIMVPARDLDFVVRGLGSDDELVALFERDEPQRTSFGGVKLEVGGVGVDIWRTQLQMQVAGREPKDDPVSEVLQYVTLTTDAVGYDIVAETLHERGFLEAMGNRTIDFGERSLWIAKWRHFHIAHLAYVRAITGFGLSFRLRQRVLENVDQSVLQQAADYLASRKKYAHPTRCLDALLAEAQR